MDNFWRFDKFTFKDATAFLLFNDPDEGTKTDFELKKLIADQFEDKSDLQLWLIDHFDKVYCSLSKATCTVIF